MTEADAVAFARRAVEAERLRRGGARTAARVAHQTRTAEELPLTGWGTSLDGAAAASGFPYRTRQEAERWMRAGRAPVARGVQTSKGGGRREAGFDPAARDGRRRESRGGRKAEAGSRQAPAEMRRVSNAAVARIAGLDCYPGHFVTARALSSGSSPAWGQQTRRRPVAG